MKRREFLVTLVGAAIARSGEASAQHEPKVVGIILPYPETDAEVQERVAALREALQSLGWRAGRNVAFLERWATDDMVRVDSAVAELVAAKPQLIIATGARVMPVLKKYTRTIPVVFVATSDPVGRGLVQSLARPGGNMTGFALTDLLLIEKLLETLKQTAPAVQRVAIVFNPDNPGSVRNVEAFREASVKLGVEPSVNPIRTPDDVDRVAASISELGSGGLLFPSDLSILAMRDHVVASAARRRVPAVYADRAMVVGGGLVSFSSDRKYLFQRAAEYAHRILHGENPAELPVQQPVKYELVVNLKTAQSLGLTVQADLLAVADEIIE
jgi:putative ABC transport system substrate-binding protein